MQISAFRCRFLQALVFVFCHVSAVASVHAIQITLDYTLDENNENWFDLGTSTGQARRASLDSAAAFLSAIITNNDWTDLTSLNGSIGFSDIQASSIVDLSGNVVQGSAESDGQGYSYTLSTSNRSSVAANEYVIYVGAFSFDSGTTAHAKGGWDGYDSRNAAGAAGSEFNTWGGRVYFDTGDNWYAGHDPGVNPVDDYGIQDPNKTPTTDISTDNWDWHTTSLKWNGFDLRTVDPTAIGKSDLYSTGLHEMIHALGATSTNLEDDDLVGVDDEGNLIGTNLVAEYGGPVPKSSTGHFASSIQSEVWSSAGIISEVSLDPNSTDGARKYLTRLDAALLRDLGYQVLYQFNPADFNFDGLVNTSDLAQWQAAYGLDSTADADNDGDSDGADFLAWQREIQSLAAPSASSVTVPEPSALVLLAAAALLCRRRVPKS
ncbi:hypothetical protein [Bythopirellula goksoeyrii]|uniref:PEP-CTERM protein-sorting domain-containing protein n=1 Tax=Bythopirellula goksoeyrii TaxID=1400387 RepID=A0A5B9QGJ8_9BACT|nr:hypothetical protein [Bythopirellula goksoeyrii]QEG36702.1 hypothetical protein Pr1d_40380 [Bythopirellula goksoeyrii]